MNEYFDYIPEIGTDYGTLWEAYINGEMEEEEA